LFVDDAAYAAVLAAETPRIAGKAFNIAGGTATTALEILDIINRSLGTQLVPIHATPPRTRQGVLVDVTRAEVELGFCPSIDLEQGLSRFIHFLTPWRDALQGVILPIAEADALGG